MIKDKNFLFKHQFKMVLSSDGNVEYDPNRSLLKDIDLYVSTSAIPGKTISQIEIQRYGITFRLPGPVEFEGTFNTTVRLDANLDIHKALLDMQNVFSDLEKSGGGERGIPNYTSRLYLLDKNMNESESDNVIVIAGIFPSEVGEVELSHEEADISTCDVTWTYQYWYYESDSDPLG
jgi:hypothetical protein